MAPNAWQLVSKMDTGDSCDSWQSLHTANRPGLCELENEGGREGGSHDFWELVMETAVFSPAMRSLTCYSVGKTASISEHPWRGTTSSAHKLGGNERSILKMVPPVWLHLGWQQPWPISMSRENKDRAHLPASGVHSNKCTARHTTRLYKNEDPTKV